MTGGKNVLLELESEQRGSSGPHKPIVFVTQSASSVGKKYSAILKIICLNSWNFTKIFYLDIIKGASVQFMFLDVCYFTSR